MRIYGKLTCGLNTGRVEIVPYAKAAPVTGFVMGIDPGPKESAYAIVRPDYTLVRAAKLSNPYVCIEIANAETVEGVQAVVIEALACYGERMIGRETWETAYMVGEFRAEARRAWISWILYDRPTYANAIAGTNKVTDAMLYQALRLRFGPATKGGPLEGLRGCSDLRSAYAIACYYLDTVRLGPGAVKLASKIPREGKGVDDVAPNGGLPEASGGMYPKGYTLS